MITATTARAAAIDLVVLGSAEFVVAALFDFDSAAVLQCIVLPVFWSGYTLIGRPLSSREPRFLHRELRVSLVVYLIVGLGAIVEAVLWLPRDVLVSVLLLLDAALAVSVSTWLYRRAWHPLPTEEHPE